MSKMFVALFAYFALVAPLGTPAHAQATIVQNRDEPVRNHYHAHATISSTCGLNGCVATFPTIPAGERVLVEYVSCWILVPTATKPFLVALDGQANFPTERAYVPALFQGDFSNIANYVVSSQVTFYFSAGDTPAISVLLNGAIATSPGDCLLTGYRVLLP